MATQRSSLPSPASANSSSTLIVTPLSISSKHDLLGSYAVHEMTSDPTIALHDSDVHICPQKISDAEEPIRGPQALTSSPQVLQESQNGGLMLPSMRSAGQLGVRVPSGASFQTRMSERGFVEPHHSNVPRRSRTRMKTKITSEVRNSEQEAQQVQDASRSPTSPAHAPISPPPPPPLSLPLPISDHPKPILVPAPPIPLITPSPNPHSARMPDQLLSLHLPTTPPPIPNTPGGLPPSSSVPHAPLAGLPQGIGLGFSTPISTPAFGVGMQPTMQPIATPATIGGTPGSGRLPTRRRRVQAGSPTPVGRVLFQGLKSSALGKEGELTFGNSPMTAQEVESEPVPATAPIALNPPPQVVPVDTPHGPPTYPTHIRTLRAVARQKREEAGAERRRKRARMGIQRVGKGAGVEVGFLDVDIRLKSEEGDEVKVEGGVEGGYVFLHVVDSDSDESDDDESKEEEDASPVRRTLSSRAFSKRRSRSAHVRSMAARGKPSTPTAVPNEWSRTMDNKSRRSRSVRERKTRERPNRAELKLPLPTDRKAFVDGSCALSAVQVWEACTFVKRVLERPTSEGRMKKNNRVRILTPRGRPEDAMGVAIAYLAYGRATTATSSTSSSPSSQSPTTSTAGAARLLVQATTASVAGDGESIGKVGGWSRRGSMAVPGDMIDVVVDIEGGGSPSTVEVEVELGSDEPRTGTTTTETTHATTIDDTPDPIPIDIVFHPDPDPEIAYTAAHTLTMALLDEGDWLSRGTLAATGNTNTAGAAAMTNAATQGELLGAGRGIVGVVDMEHPGRGDLGVAEAIGLGMLVLDGDKEEEEEWDADADEDESGESEDGEDEEVAHEDEDVLSSSAGARVDSHSGSEDLPPPPTHAHVTLNSTVTLAGVDAGGDEEEDNDDGRRRGRTVTWHGVPMPPKFVERSPSASLSRPPPPIRRSAKSTPKSKSRARGRARSQAPMLGSTPEDDKDDNHENENDRGRGREHDSRARSTRRMSRACEARKEERKRARKIERESEEYFGIGDAWRGVLSFEGLSGIGEMMRGWSGVVES